MIIVEGLDNTGKTTLAKNLCKAFNLEYVKSQGPFSEKSEAISFLDTILSKDLRKTLFDRFYLISEAVYAPILRPDQIIISRKEYDLYLARLKEHDPLIIWCWRPLIWIIATWSERPQMEGVRKRLLELFNRYHNIINGLVHYGFRVVVYNYEIDKEYIEERVADYLEHKGC